MRAYFFAIFFLIFYSCKQNNDQHSVTAQQIVDKSIVISGGENYLTHDVSYNFRDRYYESKNINGKKVLKRVTKTDSITITDVKQGNNFQRFFDGNLISLPDTVSEKYSNSVNSVHYFSRLPFGLNDKAVKKELLGAVELNGEDFYKVKVTFEQQNGGKDFEDTYLYWFQKKDFKPKYLAYEYHTDGGGIRFREAYNERYVNGIRFVDYNNLKPLKGHKIDFFSIDSLFAVDQLELLSKIEITEIRVTPSLD